MELLHNLQHCSHALMYTIHTHYTPAVVELVIELLDMCIFLHCPAEERSVAAEGSLPFWDMGLLGKEKIESGVAEAL